MFSSRRCQRGWLLADEVNLFFLFLFFPRLGRNACCTCRTVELAEEDEDRWVALLLQTARVAPASNPASGAVIAYLTDAVDLPERATLEKLAQELTALLTAASSAPAIVCNSLVVLGTLADKLAGRSSEQLLTPALQIVLLEALSQHASPAVTLHAILALEKFAQTGTIKSRLLDAGLADQLSRLEETYCYSVRKVTTSRLSHSMLNRELRRAEVGFAATWALDNVFPCEGRVYTHERTDLSQVNVMLDARDATAHLKLAADGLEIRNDALTWVLQVWFTTVGPVPV